MILYVIYSILVVAAIAAPMLIGYFLVKRAVKIAVKEAIKEAADEKILRKEVREGMREILRSVDFKAMAKIFAEEFKKNE